MVDDRDKRGQRIDAIETIGRKYRKERRGCKRKRRKNKILYTIHFSEEDGIAEDAGH